MNSFELEYLKIDIKPQTHQTDNTFYLQRKKFLKQYKQ